METSTRAMTAPPPEGAPTPAHDRSAEATGWTVDGINDPDRDIFTRTCPTSGTAAEWPDCDARGHLFDGRESRTGSPAGRAPYAAHIADEHEIPPELRQQPVWVAWQLVKKARKAKPDKVPVSPVTGRRDSWSNNPAFAGTFDQARAYAEAHRLQGLGILLWPGCGFSAIDLDHCREPLTGELSDLAREIMAAAESYTEVSPGLSGIRIIFRGSFGGFTGTDNRRGVEFYEQRRFVTITGDHIAESPFCIETRNLSGLGARYFPAKQGHAGSPPPAPPVDFKPVDINAIGLSGHTMHVIRTGDASSYAGDRSKALFAVAKDLVKRGMDDASIARVLCDPANGIARKALENRGGDLASAMDWTLKYTVTAARQAVTPDALQTSPHGEQATPGLALGLTRAGALMEQPPPLTWLVRGYLLPACFAVLFGAPKVGKSLIALAWPVAIACGLDWWGHRTAPGPVVYLAGEGHFGIRRRLKALAMHLGIESALRSAPLFISSRGARLTDPASLHSSAAEIDAIADEVGMPALICIDTLNRNFGPGDESSTEDMTAFVASCDFLRERYSPATILVVHHSGHANAERSRGSSVLVAAVDLEYCVAKAPGDATRTLRPTNTKDIPQPPTIAFDLEQIELPWRDDQGEPETSVVLVETQGTGAARKSVTPAQRMAFESLLVAIDASGFSPPTHIAETLPDGARLVGLEHWRREFYARHMGDTQHAKKVAFQRARSDLARLGAIGHLEDTYWPLPTAGGIAELQGMMQRRSLTRELREVRNAA